MNNIILVNIIIIICTYNITDLVMIYACFVLFFNNECLAESILSKQLAVWEEMNYVTVEWGKTYM